MSNQYRALGPWVALYGDKVFDADYAAGDEADLVARGELELVARQYRVLTDNYTVDGKTIGAGEVIELALPVELEAALVDGSHLERVRRDAHPTVDVEAEPDPEPKQARRRRTATPIKE